jgi:hypothetical protein
LKSLPVLHPRHKLAYFKKANWPEDWINVAKTIVRDEYEHTYKVAEGDIEVEEIENVSDIVLFVLRHLMIALDVDGLFGEFFRRS